MIHCLRCLDYSNPCVDESSTHQDKMEVMSFDNYRLAPPGWSDCSLPESGGELLEALRHFSLPKSDNYIERAKCREVF